MSEGGPLWAIDDSDPQAQSLLRKLCDPAAKPGSIIRLTPEEMAVLSNPKKFQRII